MTGQAAVLTQVTSYRNFNLCPHCRAQGQESLLSRLCEGVPMISRSDGWSFHLLLADEPQPYPAESKAGETDLVSVCFWYCHVKSGTTTRTSIVLLPAEAPGYAAFFRRIEQAADLLAERLGEKASLGTLYALESDQLKEAAL
jgi:hypothetical protein